jgi:hypothetical protein
MVRPRTEGERFSRGRWLGRGVGALVNPLNDIGLVGQALKTVGFEVMRAIQNASIEMIIAAMWVGQSSLLRRHA